MDELLCKLSDNNCNTIGYADDTAILLNGKFPQTGILSFAKKTRHSNITVMETLHRHDLDDWPCVNKETTRFNRLLAKRLKLHNQQGKSKQTLFHKTWSAHELQRKRKDVSADSRIGTTKGWGKSQ
jgi:hypothetical protein